MTFTLTVSVSDHKVRPNLCKSLSEALFQVLFCSYSHKMLIQQRPVALTAVPLCQQKVTDYVFSGCHSELFLALLTSDSALSSFFFLTANEKPVFDKLLSLPVGARCVESGLNGDKFGVSMYVFVGLVMCGRDTRGLTSWREERLQRK